MRASKSNQVNSTKDRTHLSTCCQSKEPWPFFGWPLNADTKRCYAASLFQIDRFVKISEYFCVVLHYMSYTRFLIIRLTRSKAKGNVIIEYRIQCR